MNGVWPEGVEKVEAFISGPYHLKGLQIYTLSFSIPPKNKHLFITQSSEFFQEP